MIVLVAALGTAMGKVGVDWAGPGPAVPRNCPRAVVAGAGIALAGDRVSARVDVRRHEGVPRHGGSTSPPPSALGRRHARTS